MENEILKIASSQGIWTSLSFILLFYILKQQDKRNKKNEEKEKFYQNTIYNLEKLMEKIDKIDNSIAQLLNNLLGKEDHYKN